MIFVNFMFWCNTQKGLKVINASFFLITHVYVPKEFSAFKDKRKQKGDPKIKSRIKSKINNFFWSTATDMMLRISSLHQ